MQIIVGSMAARSHIPEFRQCNDVDVWSTYKLEYCDNSVFPIELMVLFEEQSKDEEIATLNDLLTIKLSHLPYDIFWRKHVLDYLFFKKRGACVNKPLYEALQKYWLELHGNKSFLSLYRTKDSFFDDFVKKEYDHDFLHELVAHPDAPVYTKCLKEGEQVAIDHDKFLEMSFEDQVKMFREEICVIACERWLIPTRDTGKITFNQAYNKSLHKTVTALTKGWASRFICEHLEHFIRPNRGEVEHLFKHCSISI